MICNSKYIYKCYQNNDPIYHSLTAGYRREYYREHRAKLLNHQKKYYMDNKKRIQFIKSLWFQKNKERLRVKNGYKRRNKTKVKCFTSILKKPIILSFD